MQCNYIPFSVSSKIHCNKGYSGVICIWEYDISKDTEKHFKMICFDNAYDTKFSFIVIAMTSFDIP